LFAFLISDASVLAMVVGAGFVTAFHSLGSGRAICLPFLEILFIRAKLIDVTTIAAKTTPD
jgi:hypothetical protein